MKYTFQHFLDISTSADSITMIKVCAGGQYTLDRIKHLLPAFKYIKYGRVSIKLLPASTLPVDPLGLSYDADDPQTVDPRDQMNPGLVRITNGEDIMDDFTGVNGDQQQAIYVNTMLDPRWSKFMLQSGFKRSAVPLYWNVGQLAQDPYPGSIVNLPLVENASGTHAKVISTSAASHFDFGSSGVDASSLTYDPTSFVRGASDPRGFFQTGHRGRLGWMPTDAFYNVQIANGVSGSNINAGEQYNPMFMPLPEIECITAILPKAYKTKYYYRMFITETVYLTGLKNSGVVNGSTGTLLTGTEYRAVDNFIYADNGLPTSPSTARIVATTYPIVKNDGHGDD